MYLPKNLTISQNRYKQVKSEQLRYGWGKNTNIYAYILLYSNTGGGEDGGNACYSQYKLYNKTINKKKKKICKNKKQKEVPKNTQEKKKRKC